MKLPSNGVAKDIDIMLVVFIVFFLVVLILYYLTKYAIPDQNSQIVNTLIGMIAASIAMVIASITGRNPDDLESAKKKISNLEMKIEMLVQAKDMLENMLIKLQDDTIDRLLLNKTLEYDNCKTGNANVKMSVAMNLKYFKYEEFKSPDLPDSGNLMDATFLAMLDSAREIAGIPFKINSAYRSESHNRKVGGKSTSSHLVGKAVDPSIAPTHAADGLSLQRCKRQDLPALGLPKRLYTSIPTRTNCKMSSGHISDTVGKTTINLWNN